jgi:hypothetical protein
VAAPAWQFWQRACWKVGQRVANSTRGGMVSAWSWVGPVALPQPVAMAQALTIQ